MKPLAIILKTLIVGYLWSIVFIDVLRVVLLINWHFDIFLKEHWILLGEKWNSGEPITVISRLRGSCIVSIKDGRYNIDNQLAEAIII